MPLRAPLADDTNILFELREVAKHCSSAPHVKWLREAADDLAVKLTELSVDPTTARMQAANGAWMRALRALIATPPMGGTDERGGAVRLTAEQRAA